MLPKLGMNMLLWTGHVEEEHFPLFEKIGAAGFDGVEIPLFEGDSTHYAKIKRVLDDNGLECSAVTVMNEEADPSSHNPSVQEKAIDRLKWAITCTATLGADILAGPLHSALGVLPKASPSEKEKSDHMSRACETLLQAARFAKENRVTLALEFLNRFECWLCTDAEEAAEMVSRVSHPHLGMMWDTFHANIEQDDPVKDLTAHKADIIHFHASAHHRGVLTNDHIPFEILFQELDSADYSGWLTIEAFGDKLPELAAATCIWKRRFQTEEEVYEEGAEFLKSAWG